MKSYQERLKDLREDRELTQTQVANAIGIKDYNQYSRYERGDTKMTVDTFIKLCLFFNSSADYILFGKNK